MPIFQAEISEKVTFSLIRFYFLSPVKFLEKNMAYYYIFASFSEKYNTKLGIMGKAYSLPSCPEQLAVSFWIPDPVTYHVLSYPE
jgi:hypothetical protein